MKKILRSISDQGSFELKLGYLMPVFLLLGILINAQIANASALALRDFTSVAIHPSSYADYSRDALDLQFAPIDPSIIEGILLDKAPNIEADDLAPEVPLGASATPQLISTQPTSTQPTATSFISLPTLPLPTLPPLLPTLPPLLPTLPPIVPTLAPVVPTLVPIVPTAVAPIIDPISTLVPCVPVPLVTTC
jgi:hypothetical protein